MKLFKLDGAYYNPNHVIQVQSKYPRHKTVLWTVVTLQGPENVDYEVWTETSLSSVAAIINMALGHA